MLRKALNMLRLVGRLHNNFCLNHKRESKIFRNYYFIFNSNHSNFHSIFEQLICQKGEFSAQYWVSFFPGLSLPFMSFLPTNVTHSFKTPSDLSVLMRLSNAWSAFAFGSSSEEKNQIGCISKKLLTSEVTKYCNTNCIRVWNTWKCTFAVSPGMSSLTTAFR